MTTVVAHSSMIAPFERLAGREIYSSPGVFLNG